MVRHAIAPSAACAGVSLSEEILVIAVWCMHREVLPSRRSAQNVSCGGVHVFTQAGSEDSVTTAGTSFTFSSAITTALRAQV